MDGPADKQPNPEEPGDPFRYMGLGIQFAAAVGLPLGLGIWLDWRTGRSPLFTLIGLATGFAAGMYTIIKTVKPGGGGR